MSISQYLKRSFTKKMDRIGDRIKNIRINLSISQSDMANILGTNQKTLSRYENNLTFPPVDILEKLAEKYNFNLNWLITGKGEMFIESSNVQATEHLGVKKNANANSYLETQANNFYSKYLLEDSEDRNAPKELDLIKIENIIAREKEDAILIPEFFNIYRERLTAIAITSDDMQPTISKNAIVLCNEIGFVGSGIYAVKINGVYSVKRISLKNTESYIMACDNKLYETFEVATDDKRLEIIGLVRVAINIL